MYYGRKDVLYASQNKDIWGNQPATLYDFTYRWITSHKDGTQTIEEGDYHKQWIEAFKSKDEERLNQIESDFGDSYHLDIRLDDDGKWIAVNEIDGSDIGESGYIIIETFTWYVPTLNDYVRGLSNNPEAGNLFNTKT
tara:strand:+ start:55 stop:468 length:414 start_codon:yes stop_codon:yes gene_type:complete